MPAFEQDKIQAFTAYLEPQGPIVITTHFNPDGDAIGSSLGLYHVLKDLGKRVSVIVPNDYPGFLKWMPGNDQVVIYNTRHQAARKLISEATLIICLDYNSLHRTGEMEKYIRESSAVRIMIDHHPEPVKKDFDLLFSRVKTSSTSELVYDIVRQLRHMGKLRKEAAEALFVGIMTDTGSFSYACRLPHTFEVSAELVKRGIDPEEIHRRVYDTYSESRLRLLGYALSQKLVVVPELQTAYISLTLEELNKFRHQIGDTEGLVNYALSIEGIRLAVLLTQRKDRIRLSFRSKGNFNVNILAKTHFNGGGHLNAAGGDAFMALDKAIEFLNSLLPQYMNVSDQS